MLLFGLESIIVFVLYQCLFIDKDIGIISKWFYVTVWTGISYVININ